MKKQMLSLLMVAAMGTAALAQNATQNPASVQGRHKKELSIDDEVKRNTERAAKDLGLNEDQKGKWEQAARERITANKPIREKLAGSTTPEERKQLHTQAKANNDKFNAAVTGFLSPGQKAKMDSLQINRRQMGRKMKGFKPAPGY